MFYASIVTLLKEGTNAGSIQSSNGIESPNEQKLLPKAGKIGNVLDSAVQVSAVVKSNEDFTGNVVRLQHQKERNNVFNQATMQHLDPRNPKEMPKNGIEEHEWMGCNSYRPSSTSGTYLADSSLFSVSGSASTKDTTAHVSHESEQLDTDFNFALQRSMHGRGVEIKLSNDVTESTYEQGDNRQMLTSEELEDQ
ncbi:hypothetical protein KP509_06G007200 [Ceratopteris richardii]|uniref:Uncharacterized protein n=1 Tax=Ceratopteris richardii TaxID=49495 RepID=A0A8T2UK47_CERRI|nr:hypothetical protein KP509_1Z134900 [Ceratopteris richardii]KAH7434245.1 hypothetical protein KP509_06G007100 [Ceratopteris richardii]KAH7434246.1 hypothetical protein KP509_06G007200 [Ceratopteris richardii]